MMTRVQKHEQRRRQKQPQLHTNNRKMASNARRGNRQHPRPPHPLCSAQHRQGFSSSRAGEPTQTAVKVAGATAKHCVVLHGKSNFLSGNSRSTDFDHECYTRANVAYSRAADLTASACPVNMNGLAGISQVIAALLHGTCLVHF